MCRTNSGVLFYLKTPKRPISAIKCVFCFSNQQFYYYEKKLCIDTRFWNSSLQRGRQTKAFPGCFDLNTTLDNIETAILSCYRKFINDNSREPAVEELRSLVQLKRGIIKEKGKMELFEFIEQFILHAEAGKHLNLQTGKPVGRFTVLTYRQTQNLLKEFSISRK